MGFKELPHFNHIVARTSPMRRIRLFNHISPVAFSPGSGPSARCHRAHRRNTLRSIGSQRGPHPRSARGSAMGSAWAVPRMGSAWASYGSRMGPAWVPHGFRSGFRMGSEWVPNGFRMGSAGGSAWAPRGFRHGWLVGSKQQHKRRNARCRTTRKPCSSRWWRSDT